MRGVRHVGRVHVADALPDGVGGVEEVAGGGGEDQAVGEESRQAEAEGGEEP